MITLKNADVKTIIVNHIDPEWLSDFISDHASGEYASELRKSKADAHNYFEEWVKSEKYETVLGRYWEIVFKIRPSHDSFQTTGECIDDEWGKELTNEYPV